MDRAAFREFLWKLDLALFCAEERSDDEAVQAYAEASVACGFAFPLDSKESEAMGVLLAAVEPALKGATA